MLLLGCTVVIERISGKKSQQFLQGFNTDISVLAVSNSGRYVAGGQVTHIGFGVCFCFPRFLLPNI
jgi:hypothetical protein